MHVSRMRGSENDTRVTHTYVMSGWRDAVKGTLGKRVSKKSKFYDDEDTYQVKLVKHTTEEAPVSEESR